MTGKVAVLAHLSVVGKPMAGLAIPAPHSLGRFEVHGVRPFEVSGVQHFALYAPGLYIVSDFDGLVLLADPVERVTAEQCEISATAGSATFLRVIAGGVAEVISVKDFFDEIDPLPALQGQAQEGAQQAQINGDKHE